MALRVGKKADRRELIDTAMGRVPADTVLAGGLLIDVYSGVIRQADVAVKSGRIALVGEAKQCIGPDTEVMDCSGMYLTPGLMDAHIHIEAAMTSPGQFARAVLPRGNTAVNWETLWSANVLGVEGLRLLLEECRRTRLRFFLTATSGVPCASTDLVTANHVFSIEDIRELLSWPDVTGLGEVVTFNELVACRERELEQIEAALKAGKTIDGSAPGFVGRKLAAYAAAGIMSDHEATNAEEALDRLRMGLRLVIREGSSMRNIADILSALAEEGADTRRCCFCVDDKDIREIAAEGLIDDLVRKAMSAGIDPVKAVQMGSLNTAEYLRLDEEIGGIAPGRLADILLISDLKAFTVRRVMVGGRIVAENGKLTEPAPEVSYPEWALNTVKLKRELTGADFACPTTRREESRVRVVKVLSDQIISYEETATLPVVNGEIRPDPGRDILKLVVVERHGRTPPNIARGFVRGFGFTAGAVGMSISPDHHQLIAVGTDDTDLQAAFQRLVEIQGGVVVCREGRVLAELSLPIAGLMTAVPYEDTIRRLEEISAALRGLGCKLPSPLMTLAFAGCPTLIEFKLSDKGLIRIGEGKLVSLEVAEA